jgi:DNA-binding XRE family transcriptional regulator
MSSPATLQNESWPIGGQSSPATTSNATILYREFGAARPFPIANTRSLASVIGEFEEDDAIAATNLADVRRNLAATLYADNPETLSVLRLSAGLSQVQLASRAGTHQPYIARIERGQTDPSTDMIARIAEALGVDEALAFRAIRSQRVTHG